MNALANSPRHNLNSDDDIARLYLADIGRYPLLTKADESRLAGLVAAGQVARARLQAAEEPSAEELSASSRRSLRAAAATADAATDTFVKANLRLVVSIAKKYQLRTGTLAHEATLSDQAGRTQTGLFVALATVLDGTALMVTAGL